MRNLARNTQWGAARNLIAFLLRRKAYAGTASAHSTKKPTIKRRAPYAQTAEAPNIRCFRCLPKISRNSIPSKETVAAYILEKGEQYAAEQLRGQDRNSVRRSWGDPDAMPSGIWADVWDLDADTTLLVFYDAENKDAVERVVLGQKGG